MVAMKELFSLLWAHLTYIHPLDLISDQEVAITNGKSTY